MENIGTNEEMLRLNINTIRTDFFAGGCGYCKDKNTNLRKYTSYKNYLNIKKISVNILQDMVIKGWARCGNCIYKTNYEKTCCKLYQPRVNINNFKISKEQKKIMKRFRKYLSGEYENNKLMNKEKEIEKKEKEIIKDEIQDKLYIKMNEFIKSNYLFDILNKYIYNKDEINEIYDKIKYSKIRKNNNKKANFDYSCDLIFIIKNVLMYLRKKNGINIINKNEPNNINDESKKFINNVYSLFIKYFQEENFILSFNEQSGHINFIMNNKVDSIKDNVNNNIINKINEIKENIPKITEEKIYNKEKQEKKEIPKEKYIFDYFKEIVPEPEIYLPLKHTYTIELTDKIKLKENDERFLLYRKYQLRVHKDFVTVDSYNNFIGASPLEKKRIELPKDLKLKTNHPELYPEFYGTYNLIHRIDGKIIAVTCWDILPNYLESMYCYYDPDYSFLDLGVVTAIREIEYMKSFQELIDKSFIYYTMGEMSHSVQKLRYKGNYFPTEIMDHYTGIYVLLTDEVKKIIGDNKCHHLVQNKPSLFMYFTDEEINYYLWSIIIDVFGDKISFDNFLNLYFEDQKNKNILLSVLKRLLEIIDIESFSKISLYYEPN